MYITNPIKAKPLAFRRPVLHPNLRSPVRSIQRKGLRITMEGPSLPISKNTSPNRSFLPTIGHETLSGSLASNISSTMKFNISLTRNTSLGLTETPKDKQLTGAFKTSPGLSHSTQPKLQDKQQLMPMSPIAALKAYPGQLTSYEESEIVNHSQVYFLGLKANKVQPDETLPNSGYDDEKGYYKAALSDHIVYRFEVIQVLGKGSFGQVLRCLDHKRNTLVALKVIRNKKRFHRQAAVEVRILQQLRDQDLEDTANCVHLKQFFHFRRHLVRGN